MDVAYSPVNYSNIQRIILPLNKKKKIIGKRIINHNFFNEIKISRKLYKIIK